MESSTPSFSILENGYKESLKQLDSLKSKIQMRRTEQVKFSAIKIDEVNVLEQSWVASTQGDEGFKENLFDQEYEDIYDISDLHIYQKSRNQIAETSFMQSIEKASSLSPDHFDASNRKAIRGANSVVERSNMMMQMRKEKADAMRKNFEEISMEELRSAPEINKKSKMLNRSLSDMLTWDEARKAKLEARALEAKQEESAAVTGCPVVTKLAQKLRDVNSGSSSVTQPRNVEDRLLGYEERKQIKLKQMMDEKESERNRQASASYVAPHSASLQRAGDVADRLYHLASVQQKERLQRTEVANNLYAYDSTTGEKLFQPRLNKTTEKIAHNSRPHVRVEDLLHRKGQLYRQNQLAKEKRLESRAENMRETSKMNPVSQRIVHQRYVMQGETVGDRLSKPIGTVKQRTLQEMQQELTFKPKIGSGNTPAQSFSVTAAPPSPSPSLKLRPSTHSSNPPSSHDYLEYNDIGSYSDFYEPEEQLQYATGVDPDAEENSENGTTRWSNNNDDRMNSSVSRSSTPSGSSVYLRSKKWDERRQLKIQRDQQARLQQELQECSFQPRVPKDDKDRDDASRSGSIADRNSLWAQRREQKLEVGRLKAERDAVLECSFRPAIRSEPGARSRSRSTDRSRATSESSALIALSRKDGYINDNGYSDVAAYDTTASRGKIPIPIKARNGSSNSNISAENDNHRQQYSEDEDSRFYSATSDASFNNSRENSRQQFRKVPTHHNESHYYDSNYAVEQSFLPPEQVRFVDSAMESYSAHLMKISKGGPHHSNAAQFNSMGTISYENFAVDDSDSLSAAYELEF